MNYHDYFFYDNKSGHKSKESWLIKNYPELHSKITNNCDLELPFLEKIYLFIHDMNKPPKCKYCGNFVNFRGNLKKGYNDYCSIKCLNRSSEHKKKIRETNMKNHGVISHNQIDSIKTKKQLTTIKNYGVCNPMKNPHIVAKQKKSLFEKYMVNNPMKIPAVKTKRKALIYSGEEYNINNLISKISDDYEFVKHENSLLTLRCKKCDNEFEISSNFLNSRYIHNKTICLACNPKRNYLGLYEIIRTYIHDINHEINNRSKLKGKEIDVYFPEYNVGIELNGLYCHSSLYKDKNYHLNKMELAHQNNVKLFQFFEDEILTKSDIVGSMIRSKLGCSDNKIYARNCLINEIYDNQCVKKFLESNHIQGYVGAKHKIGLYYNNELIAIMTFGKLRKSLGGTAIDNTYELLRFCNKTNTNVVGGAGKLLSYFKKTYNPNMIITYANRNYSNGDLYDKLGFKFIKNTTPNYFYYKTGNLFKENRFKYRKDVLVKNGFDAKLTEKQIMESLGYLRIYDSGNKKYVLSCC